MAIPNHKNVLLLCFNYRKDNGRTDIWLYHPLGTCLSCLFLISSTSHLLPSASADGSPSTQPVIAMSEAKKQSPATKTRPLTLSLYGQRWRSMRHNPQPYKILNPNTSHLLPSASADGSPSTQPVIARSSAKIDHGGTTWQSPTTKTYSSSVSIT